jgi:hypothetical protein
VIPISAPAAAVCSSSSLQLLPTAELRRAVHPPVKAIDRHISVQFERKPVHLHFLPRDCHRFPTRRFSTKHYGQIKSDTIQPPKYLSIAYRKLTLWTNNVLISVRHIYEAAGFRMLKEDIAPSGMSWLDKPGGWICRIGNDKNRIVGSEARSSWMTNRTLLPDAPAGVAMPPRTAGFGNGRGSASLNSWETGRNLNLDQPGHLKNWLLLENHSKRELNRVGVLADRENLPDARLSWALVRISSDSVNGISAAKPRFPEIRKKCQPIFNQ